MSGPVAGPAAGAGRRARRRCQPEAGQEPVGGKPGNPGGLGRRVLRRAAQPDPMDIDAQQLGVVVEHFLEVRNGPVSRHRIAREAAVELVEQRRAGHCCQAPTGHVPGRRRGLQARGVLASGVRSGCRRHAVRGHCGVTDQEFEHGRGRELRCAAEAAVGPVLGAGEGGDGFAKERRVQGFGRPVEAQGGCRLGGGDAARQGGRVGLDGAAAFRPGLAHGFNDLPEGRTARHGPGWEIGAGMEGAAIGQEEDGHRPAALAADRLRRCHVDSIDVGALFPVHLDGDKVGVQVVGGVMVLKGFMGHDVAPVAGRVAD